tara:strand:- start:444 stop:854 length:411 start_codon:yes stop_codon:yes gene_type:complete
MVFWKKKKDDVVDLGTLYKRQKQRLAEIQGDMQEQGTGSDFVTYPATSPSPSTESSSSDGSALGFLGNLAGAGSSARTTETYGESDSYESSGTEDKRRKLAKRLMDMTTKLEDINNQIYHIQQRLEVLEAKIQRDY